jgi:hypothetical protein
MLKVAWDVPQGPNSQGDDLLPSKAPFCRIFAAIVGAAIRLASRDGAQGCYFISFQNQTPIKPISF